MMTAALVSIISRVITSQQFFLYNSITFISISIASIPVPATHIPTTNIINNQYMIPAIISFGICITKISTFLILCDLAVCLATLYVSFSLVFALMRYLQGKVFLIRFYSPTTLSSSRAEFRLPSRLACA